MKVTQYLRRGRSVVLTLVACLLLALAAPAFAGGRGEAESGTKGTIALSFPGLDVPYIGETFEVAERLLNKAGYDVVGHDPQWDSNVQRNDWDTWISEGEVDLIAFLIVTDPQQWEPVSRKAEASGVKLISSNMTITPQVENFMFEDDYTLGYSAGEAMAEWMKERFNGASRKVMVSMSENPMFRNRGQGVIDALGDLYPTAQIIEYTWGDHSATYDEISNILTAHPDAKILFNASEVAFAAYSAMLDAGIDPKDPDAGIFHLNIDNSIIPVYENPDSIIRYAATMHPADWALAIASLAINAMEGGPAIPYYATKLPVSHEGAYDQWLGGGFPAGKTRRAAPESLEVCYVEDGKWVNPNSLEEWPYLQDPNIPEQLWDQIPEPWQSNME